MKVGTEDKKKSVLAAGLALVALTTVYVQFFSGGSSAKAPRPRPAAARPQSQASPAAARPNRGVAAASTRRPPARRNLSNTFEPIWRQSHEGEFNPLEADPTLRTDLLAAVRTVPMSPYSRNIFELGERRRIVEPLSDAEIQKATERATPAPEPPPAPKPTVAAAPSKPTAPRLTWKYYGFASPTGDGKRRAFLLDGEHVLIGAEGDVFRERYKVKRVGLTAIVVEDLQYSEEQTLPISAPAS
jgi:hypothetical protein